LAILLELSGINLSLAACGYTQKLNIEAIQRLRLRAPLICCTIVKCRKRKKEFIIRVDRGGNKNVSSLKHTAMWTIETSQ